MSSYLWPDKDDPRYVFGYPTQYSDAPLWGSLMNCPDCNIPMIGQPDSHAVQCPKCLHWALTKTVEELTTMPKCPQCDKRVPVLANGICLFCAIPKV